MKKITSFILSLLCAFTMLGCGGGDDSSSNQNTEWEVVKEATCTETGLQQKYVNGELVEETIEALGHEYGAWTTTLTETCTVDGKKERQCTRCTHKEKDVITAHHVLKQGYKFDMDTHYYECENCVEKIDLSNHEFEIETEDKYAYFLDGIDLFGDTIMAKVGCVSTLHCDTCDMTIVDYNLIKKYSYSNDSTCQIEYARMLGVTTYSYDLLYGLDVYYTPEIIEFTYDSNYNVSSFSYSYSEYESETIGTYTYTYNENDLLTKVEISINIFIGYEFWYDFEYTDKTLTTINYNAKYTLGETTYVSTYELDSEGNIAKHTNYSNLTNGMKIKREEFIYNKGYLTKESSWSYDSEGEVINERVTQYNNVFDSNGNLIEHNQEGRTILITYNSDNQITSVTVDGVERFAFVYNNKQLTELTYNSTYYVHTYNYQYGNNTVVSYDNNNKLCLNVEYVSGRTIVE